MDPIRKFPPAQDHYPIEKLDIDAPPLTELLPIITSGLKDNFKDSNVEVITCPDLRQPPFHLAAAGLSGSERIADVGGPANLHPTPKFEKQYSLLSILDDIGLSAGFLLGASAGPFHQIGHNTELIPNISRGVGENEIWNRTHYVKVGKQGQCFGGRILQTMRDFGLMANLFASEGRPGPVLKITASQRTGPLNFLAAIQEALRTHYRERTVSLGGVFLINKGKANLHVMPDFCKEALEDKDVMKWLKFYEIHAPLICLSVFHSHDPGLDLRMEHTHCFSVNEDKALSERGGHYHGDATPDEVQYEAYFNTAKVLYRIDRPTI